MKLAHYSVLVLFVLALSACKEENQSPVISFVTPTADTLLDRSERIDFEVNASDPDGEIRNVDFYLNDESDPAVYTSSPYRITYEIDSDEHDGINTITAIAFDKEGGEALVQRKVTMSDFRNAWIGSYEGEARRYSDPYVAGHGLYFVPGLGTYQYDVNSRIAKPQTNENDHLVVILENDGNPIDTWNTPFDTNGRSEFIDNQWSSGFKIKITWTFEGDSLHIIHLKSYYDAGDIVHQYGLKRVD